MEEFWKIAVGTCGIGAVGAFVFWSLYKNWLKLKIFAKMTKKQTFILMLIFLFLTFGFGIAALYVYFHVQPTKEPTETINNTDLEELKNQLEKSTEVFKELQTALNKNNFTSEMSEQISALYERKRELNEKWRNLYGQYKDPPESLGESIAFRRQTIRIKMQEIVDEIESINSRLSKFEGKPETEYEDRKPPLPPTGLHPVETD